MLNYRAWVGGAITVAALLLAACGGGGGGSSGTASVRLVDASPTHASLAMLANGAASVGATATDSASAYVGVAAGGPTLQINDGTSGIAVATLVPSLGQNAHYAILAYDAGGSVHTAVIGEDAAVPVAGTVSLRVFDAATDAGAIDVYVTDPAVDITTLSSPSVTFPAATTLQTSTFVSIAPGTYRIRVTGGGNPNDLRLDVPSVTLTSQEIASLLLTPTTGGTLVNGAILAQQGDYTSARNQNARVRLAAAVASAASVTASAGTTPIGTGVLSPSVGGYVVVPANSALNVSVNGASVGAPAGTLAAGSDSTLLVHGSAAAPTASLIADDNHLPTSTSNLKLRLVNGLTGAAPPLTLDAAFAVIASNVAPGTASSYAVVASSTALRVDVFSPSSLIPLFSDSTLSVPGNAVFTLFMLGDAASPVALLRKDR